MCKGLLHKILLVLMLTPMVLAASVTVGRAEEESPPVSEAATVVHEQQGDCRNLMAGIEEQNRKVNQELRQIKREIAALNQNLENPGMQGIMGGIGYILGLFGIAAFFAARRQNKGSRGD
jgi:hypothetical protein